MTASMADSGKSIVFRIIYHHTAATTNFARERCLNSKGMRGYLEIEGAKKGEYVVMSLEFFIS